MVERMPNSNYSILKYPLNCIGNIVFSVYKCTWYDRKSHIPAKPRYQLLVDGVPQYHTLFQNLKDAKEYLRDEWDQWLYYKFDEVE